MAMSSPLSVTTSAANRDCAPPERSAEAAAGASHFPSLVMAMGMTSNFFRSMASMTAVAERMDISCSPDRPPKMRPTRSFFDNFPAPFSLKNCFP